MSRTVTHLVWPTLVGVMVALLVVQYFPQILKEGSTQLEIITRDQTRDPNQATHSYWAAVEKASKSVVSIYTRTRTSSESDSPEPATNLTNLGSGVIVTEDGYVVTNNHVVAAASEVIVALSDNREGIAQIIGTDPDSDLALLKLDLEALPSIPLISSDNLRVGDVVLAIGNPFGVGQTVTQGIISGLERNTLGLNTYEDFIQTDAAINPGNSGGALITSNGDLAGINTAIFSRSGGSQGIGFAIPSDQVQQVMSDLIKYGRVIRGWVGVQAHGLTAEGALQAGLAENQRGLLITGVYADSPAFLAGVLPGDILISINDEPVQGTGLDSMNYIARVRPGEITYFTLLRQGEQLRLRIVTRERPVSD